MKLYEVAQLDGNYLTSYLFKQASFINKHHANSVPHLSLRLRIVRSILAHPQQLYTEQLRKLTRENFPLDVVNPAIIACSAANNLDHRESAKQCVSAIYYAFGYDHIQVILDQLSIKQLQAL